MSVEENLDHLISSGVIEVICDHLTEASEELKASSELTGDIGTDLGLLAGEIIGTLGLDANGQNAFAAVSGAAVRAGYVAVTLEVLSGLVAQARDNYIDAENLAIGYLNEGWQGLALEGLYLGARGLGPGGKIIGKLDDSVPGGPIISQLSSRALFGFTFYLDTKLNGEQFASARRDARLEKAGMSASWRKDLGAYILGVEKKSGAIRDLNTESVRLENPLDNASMAELEAQLIDVPVSEAEIAHNNEIVAQMMDRLDERDMADGIIQEYDGMIIRKIYDEQGNVISAFVYVPGTDSNSQAYRGGLSTWGTTVATANADGLDTLAEGTSMMQLTDEALSRAGVGADIPLYFSGFSQGAMTLAALGTNKEFRSKYNVAGMHLHGSPLGDMELAKDTPVRLVNDVSDGIPYLQGKTQEYKRGNNVSEIKTSFNLTGEGLEKVLPYAVNAIYNPSNPVANYKFLTAYNSHGSHEYAVATANSPSAMQAYPELEKLRAQSARAESTVASGSTYQPGTGEADIQLNRRMGVAVGAYEVVEDVLDNSTKIGSKLPELPEEFSTADIYDNYIAPMPEEHKMVLNEATMTSVERDYRMYKNSPLPENLKHFAEVTPAAH